MAEVPDDVVREIAQRLGRPVMSVFYAALKQLGVVVLDGTKDEGHMAEDLELLRLDEADVAAVDGVLTGGAPGRRARERRRPWVCLRHFLPIYRWLKSDVGRIVTWTRASGSSGSPGILRSPFI